MVMGPADGWCLYSDKNRYELWEVKFLGYIITAIMASQVCPFRRPALSHVHQVLSTVAWNVAAVADVNLVWTYRIYKAAEIVWCDLTWARWQRRPRLREEHWSLRGRRISSAPRWLPLHPRVKVSIVGSLRDREVACSASDRQGSNFDSCVRRTVSSQSSHHPQAVLLAQFSLYVHKGGLKPDSFHFLPRWQELIKFPFKWCIAWWRGWKSDFNKYVVYFFQNNQNRQQNKLINMANVNDLIKHN